MTLVEDFERSHLREFADYEEIQLPQKTWRTPCRRWWTPQAVLEGWRPRISDHWAWVTLHFWIVKDLVTVKHVELPTMLMRHDPSDEAWAYIDKCFGPGDREVHAHPIGRADLVCFGEHSADGASSPLLFVEFGTCEPVKFVLNLGYSTSANWMIVPYGCRYAFTFIPKQALFTIPSLIDPAELATPRKKTRKTRKTNEPVSWPPSRAEYERCPK